MTTTIPAITSQPKFFTAPALFTLVWQTWKKVIPKYLYFLVPFFLLQLLSYFLVGKYTTGLGHTLVILFDVIHIGFVGVLDVIVACLIFRDRHKKLSFASLYGEASKLFWGYWLEYWIFIILVVGGFGLFIIPGIILGVWFGYFGWLRVYGQDAKRLHLGESRGLVAGYAGQIFWKAQLLVGVYVLGFVFLVTWLASQPGFAVGSWMNFGQNVLFGAVSIFIGSLIITMDGVIFEWLLKVKSPIQPKKITKPVIVSVIGWLVGWLLMLIVIGVIIILAQTPSP